mmetsp:Transcript_83214/g.222411  ORF Transcript_83214/g.222411 Transcript_83214/m.222411 type:complete len:402 (-) Transcript_83214:6-1211(-)
MAPGKAKSSLPPEVANDERLTAAIAKCLPPNYNFDIRKTVWRIRKSQASTVGLQMPEGLLMFGCVLADIFTEFCGVSVTIFGDVVYGACCVDDIAARQLGVDFLVHYGHSCLVPVDQSLVAAQYVFVEIAIDCQHLVDTITLNFDTGARLALLGTVQFGVGLREAKVILDSHFSHAILLPQVRPLAAGEVIGCTAPKLDANLVDHVIFVADGRFHLEAVMLQNPGFSFFRYDPYSRCLSRESYDNMGALKNRTQAVTLAKGARLVGLILGTLGRQGSVGVLEHLQDVLEKAGVKWFVVLLSEVTPDRLRLFSSVEAFVQVACPRVSIDWGQFFDVPVLTPFEAFVAWGSEQLPENGAVPMDYYSSKGGHWSNYGASTGFSGSLKDAVHSRAIAKRQLAYEL